MNFFDSVSQDSWETIANIGFVVVIVGVALEIIDLVVKWRKEHRHESILEKDAWWIWWIEASSVILVVVGLAVEFGGSFKAASLAQKKIGSLAAAAKIAFDKAAAAEKEAGESKMLAAQIGTTNAQLMASNLKIAEQLNESINDRIRLGMALFPRSFPVSHWQSIARLRKFAGTKFSLRVLSDDKESLDLENEIKEVLKYAIWQQVNELSFVFNSDGVGLIVEAAPGQVGNGTVESEKCWQAAGALIHEFRTNNISAVRMRAKYVPPTNVVAIIIGRKPNVDELKNLYPFSEYLEGPP